jgi:hypothetical protein
LGQTVGTHSSGDGSQLGSLVTKDRFEGDSRPHLPLLIAHCYLLIGSRLLLASESGPSVLFFLKTCFSFSAEKAYSSSLATMGRFAYTRRQRSPRLSINAGERIQTVGDGSVVAPFIISNSGGAFIGIYRLFFSLSRLSIVLIGRPLLASESGLSVFFFMKTFCLSAEKTISSSLATMGRVRGCIARYADGRGLADDGRGLADDERGLADDERGLADDGRGLADDERGLADDETDSGQDSRIGAESASARAETWRGRAFQRHHNYGFNPYGLRQTAVGGDKYLFLRRKANVHMFQRKR